jgi:hypothetical protein
MVAAHRVDPDLDSFPTFRPQQIYAHDPKDDKKQTLSTLTFLKDGTMSGWVKFGPQVPPVAMQGVFIITKDKADAEALEKFKAYLVVEEEKQELIDSVGDVFDVVCWTAMAIDNEKMNNSNNGKPMMLFDPKSGRIFPKQRSGTAKTEFRWLDENEVNQDRHFFAPNPWPEEKKPEQVSQTAEEEEEQEEPPQDAPEAPK